MIRNRLSTGLWLMLVGLGVVIGCRPTLIEEIPEPERLFVNTVSAPAEDSELVYETVLVEPNDFCPTPAFNANVAVYHEFAWSVDGRFVLTDWVEETDTGGIVYPLMYLDVAEIASHGMEETVGGSRPPRNFGFAASLSPDGRWVAYVMTTAVDSNASNLGLSTSGPSYIVIEDLVDGSSRRLYEIGLPNYHADLLWSPTGNYLAALVVVNGLSYRLDVIDSDSGALVYQVFEPDPDHFVWDPGGRTIAGSYEWLSPDGVDQDHPLYLARIDGRTTETIGLGPCRSGGLAWSPTGEFLALSYAQDMRETADGQSTYDLALLRADTLDVEKLTEGDSYDLAPTWSPDGERIAFESYGRPEPGQREICLIDREGHDLGCVTDTPNEEEFRPRWSPTGEWIAFIAYDGDRLYLAAVRPDGTERTRLFTWP